MRISRVKIADWAVLKGGGLLMTIGLGSCVGVTLYGVHQRIGGLVHILLPDSKEFPQRPAAFNPAKFADTAVPLLVQEIEKVGGKKRQLQAKIAGGSQLFMFQKTGSSVGEKNVLMTRQVLGELAIPIAGEDVGGNYGRTLRFFVESGRVVISTVGRGEKDV